MEESFIVRVLECTRILRFLYDFNESIELKASSFQIRGRGFDRVIMIKDLNMFEWMGGNCYRTSHYPYSQERAFEADRRGIAVITEVPAVGMRSALS